MQYQIKLLRRGGVRLSYVDVQALPWVVGHVITSKGPGGRRLCIYPQSVNLLLNPTPARELFKATIQEIDRDTTTYMGIEQHAQEDGTVAAVAQEWMLASVSVGSGGWSGAKARGVTNELDKL